MFYNLFIRKFDWQAASPSTHCGLKNGTYKGELEGVLRGSKQAFRLVVWQVKTMPSESQPPYPEM